MTESLFNEATETTSYDKRFLIDAKKSQVSPLETQLLNDAEQSILPLGKTLHMLLHVKAHVLTTAMDEAWKKPPTQIPAIITASPVVKALLSLDLYLTEHTSDSFLRHIYDPLKMKILKPSKDGKHTASNSLQLLAGLVLWSPHQARYQQWIEQEMTQTDKRGALSSVLILSFITKQWQPLDDHNMHTVDQSDQVVMMATTYISPLMTVLERHGELPTLLACTTYDTLLTISVYMMDAYLLPTTATTMNHDISSNAKISMIDDETEDQVDSGRLKWVQDVWPRLDSMLVMIEKWQQPKDLITNGAWKELHTFMSKAHHVLLGTRLDEYQQVRKSWSWLSKVLVSSQILSRNPTKKMGFIWKLEDQSLEPNLSSYLKILMLALRQNGHWIEYQTIKSSLSGNEQLFQQQTRSYCRSMIEGYPMLDPWIGLNQTLIPIIMTTTPQLYLDCHIPLSIYSLLLDFPWDTIATAEIHSPTLTRCFLSQPHDTIPLLVSKMQPDQTTHIGQQQQQQATSNLSCNILDEIISMNSTSSSLDSSILFEQLTIELLTRVFINQKSCELFIRCLPFIRKSVLLLNLMEKLAMAENERTNHVAKGLIAKILLVGSWCGDSVLIYIDLVREFLRTRQYQTTFKCMTMAKGTTPNDIYHMYDDDGKIRQEENGSRLGHQELENVEMELLWPIQLWSSKVDSGILERIIPLLINKYYHSPDESIFIRVWQMLAYTITQQKSLVLAIVLKCTEIMENQKSLFELIRQGTMRKDDIDYFTLLLPILVLRIFPRTTFEHIALPSSVIQKWHGRWPHSDNGQRCKVADSIMDENESRLYIRLANELLLRYDYSGQIDGTQQIQKLTLDTLDKIFYLE